MNWFGVLTSKSRCKMEWCRFPFRSHSWCRNGEARVFFGTRKGIRPEKLRIRPLVRNFKCGTVWPRFTWKMAIKTVCMCAYWLKWHFCANVAVAFCRVRMLIASHALRYWGWQHKQVKWTACVGLVADDHGSQSLGQCYSSVCVCVHVCFVVWGSDSVGEACWALEVHDTKAKGGPEHNGDCTDARNGEVHCSSSGRRGTKSQIF